MGGTAKSGKKAGYGENCLLCVCVLFGQCDV